MGYPSALVSLFCQSILLEYMIFLHPSLSGKASSFRIPGYRDPPHVCVSICPLISFFSGSLYQSLSLLGRLDLMDLFSWFFVFFMFCNQARALFLQRKYSPLNYILTLYIFSWLSSLLSNRIFSLLQLDYEPLEGRNCCWFAKSSALCKYITNVPKALWKYPLMCRRTGNICSFRLVCEWSQSGHSETVELEQCLEVLYWDKHL